MPPLSSDPTNPQMPGPDQPPSRIGSYEIRRLLGSGGMGVVFEAFDPHLRKRVALKTLKPGETNQGKTIARFHREMAAVGNLDHPHLVRALYAGAQDGQPFLVMDFCEGLDLNRLVKLVGPLTVADACEIGRQVALGMQYIHDQKMVHRDIKPSNLMLTKDGVVKILDLGLALFQPDHPAHDTLSETGQTMGTGDYMAPEQAADAHRADGRADLYSLGCTLYKLLAGQPPFAGPRFNTIGKKIVAHATLPPPPLLEQRPDVPPKLASLVHRLLEKDPNRRSASALVVAEALETWRGTADLVGLIRWALSFDSAEDKSPDWPGKGLVHIAPKKPGAALSLLPTQPSTIRDQEAVTTPFPPSAPALKPRSRRRGAALALLLLLGAITWFTLPPRQPSKVETEPEWPADYPDFLRDRVVGQPMALLALREAKSIPHRWRGARHQGQLTLPGKILEPWYCRRVWGTGVYTSTSSELVLFSDWPSSENGLTAFALEDDPKRRDAAIEVGFFRNDFGVAPCGLFFGWRKDDSGLLAKTFFLRLNFENPRHIFGDLSLGIAELTWQENQEKSWTFQNLFPEFDQFPLADQFRRVQFVQIQTRQEEVVVLLNGKAVFQFKPPFDPRGLWGIFVERGGTRIASAKMTMLDKK